MKCVITGVAGFLGSNLLPVLLREGCDVVGLDNLSHGFVRNIEAYLRNRRFRFVRGDIRDAATVAAVAEGATCVVHLAAGKIPRYGNSLETLDTNLLGGRNVLEVCKRFGARAVMASTSDVYGMSDALPFCEDGRLVLGAPVVRRWAYAATKIINEHLALAYRDAYGIDVVLLRFFGSYGENQNVTWRGGAQSVFIGAALRRQPMDIHGDGLQTRSFTYVSDTVAGIAAAIHEPRAAGQIINIGNDREISILGLANMIWNIVQPSEEPLFRFVPYERFGKYEDVRRRVPDTTRARQILDFMARVPLEEGLPRAAEWQARFEKLPFTALRRT